MKRLHMVAGIAVIAGVALAQTPRVRIDVNNWGGITAPVYKTSESGVYRNAELFAGPNKFGGYFSGVLPNGKTVKPAGVSVQVGKNPLGAVLTADGKFLITSNGEDRNDKEPSLQNPVNLGGHTLSVVSTGSMSVVSQINSAGKFFLGMQVSETGPYTVWASGGGDNDVKLFTVSEAGEIGKATPASIPIKPILPKDAGYVTNYVPGANFNTRDAAGNLPPIPERFDRTAGAQITFPAGSALSPDGKFLYVACNGDNSVAVIDTAARKVVRQVPVRYLPGGVSVSSSGAEVLVSNWGVTVYQFWAPLYDPASGNLIALGMPG